jgi:hypothetical protein
VAVAEELPLTVRRKVPLGTPVPVRGRRVGEFVSELSMVRVPLLGPRVVGVKVMVTGQLELARRVVVGLPALVAQGVVTA